jgi:hypothetical protein
MARASAASAWSCPKMSFSLGIDNNLNHEDHKAHKEQHVFLE